MNKIKAFMNIQNISFSELQEKSGLAKGTIAKVVNNKTIPDSMRIGTLRKIADVLNCSLGELISNEIPKIKVSKLTPQKNNVFEGKLTLENSRKQAETANLIIHFERQPTQDPKVIQPLGDINIYIFGTNNSFLLKNYYLSVSEDGLESFGDNLIKNCSFNYLPKDLISPIRINLTIYFDSRFSGTTYFRRIEK